MNIYKKNRERKRTVSRFFPCEQHQFYAAAVFAAPLFLFSLSLRASSISSSNTDDIGRLGAFNPPLNDLVKNLSSYKDAVEGLKKLQGLKKERADKKSEDPESINKKISEMNKNSSRWWRVFKQLKPKINQEARTYLSHIESLLESNSKSVDDINNSIEQLITDSKKLFDQSVKYLEYLLGFDVSEIPLNEIKQELVSKYTEQKIKVKSFFIQIKGQLPNEEAFFYALSIFQTKTANDFSLLNNCQLVSNWLKKLHALDEYLNAIKKIVDWEQKDPDEAYVRFNLKEKYDLEVLSPLEDFRNTYWGASGIKSLNSFFWNWCHPDNQEDQRGMPDDTQIPWRFIKKNSQQEYPDLKFPEAILQKNIIKVRTPGTNNSCFFYALLYDQLLKLALVKQEKKREFSDALGNLDIPRIVTLNKVLKLDSFLNKIGLDFLSWLMQLPAEVKDRSRSFHLENFDSQLDTLIGSLSEKKVTLGLKEYIPLQVASVLQERRTSFAAQFVEKYNTMQPQGSFYDWYISFLWESIRGNVTGTQIRDQISNTLDRPMSTGDEINHLKPHKDQLIFISQKIVENVKEKQDRFKTSIDASFPWFLVDALTTEWSTNYYHKQYIKTLIFKNDIFKKDFYEWRTKGQIPAMVPLENISQDDLFKEIDDELLQKFTNNYEGLSQEKLSNFQFLIPIEKFLNPFRGTVEDYVRSYLGMRNILVDLNTMQGLVSLIAEINRANIVIISLSGLNSKILKVFRYPQAEHTIFVNYTGNHFERIIFEDEKSLVTFQ